MSEVATVDNIPAHILERMGELGRIGREEAARLASEKKRFAFLNEKSEEEPEQSKVESTVVEATSPQGFQISPELVRRKAELEAEKERAPDPSKIKATPFQFRSAAEIPARQFVYGQHLIRRFVSTTIGHGGGGKSALLIVEALAMASGKPLIGDKPIHPLRVWYWNGEDPFEEMERRVAATMQAYSLTPEDIGDRLFIDSGRSMEIILATQTREGVKVTDVIAEALIQTIKENRIDVVIIDPFVSSHRVTENDNNAIEAVVKKWAHLAEETGCAIDLVHHSRKTGGQEVSVEDGRGASALLAAVRSARTVNTMTKDEATKALVENRRRYFRVDNGKANLAPPSEEATWREFRSVELANGDLVGVPIPWDMPTVMASVTPTHMERLEQTIRAGGPWRKSDQIKDKSSWIGAPMAAALDLDPEKDKARIKKILAELIKNETLEEYEHQDGKREKRPCIRWKGF
jgi:hypothetical protein